MLCELSVTNLALIEDVRVELRPGFCAWTGETGAGKSLLLGALGLLLGERGSTESIRAGSDELRVVGRFELVRPGVRPAIEAILDRELAEPQLLLARRLFRNGRSQGYLNDEPISITTMKKVGEFLIDIHGQRESQSLLEPAYQLQLLDAYGGLEKLVAAYREKAQTVRDMRKRYAQLVRDQESRRRELALFRYEREELEAANLRPGECNELLLERDRLTHAQALQIGVNTITLRLYDDEDSVVDQIGRLAKEAANLAPFDPRLAEIHQRLDALLDEVGDIAGLSRDLTECFESDPERLEAIEKRLALVKRLEAKYRLPERELIAYYATLSEKAASLQQEEDDFSSLVDELRRHFDGAKRAAESLRAGRAKVAKKLGVQTQKHLKSLGMPTATLETVLIPIDLGDDPLAGDLPNGGADQLEFMLAANVGEPARVLRKVASGGEMSRTMLALKSVLSEHDPVGTLIFDEIDARERRRPPRRRAGRQARPAGQDAPDHLRDALAAGRRLRPAPMDDPQNDEGEAHLDDDHAAAHGRGTPRRIGENAARRIGLGDDAQRSRRNVDGGASERRLSAELFCRHFARWPIDAEQALEVIIAADVDAANAGLQAVALAVCMAAERQRDAVGVAGQQRFDAAIPRVTAPLEGFRAQWFRSGEVHARKGRVVRHDQCLWNLRQCVFQHSAQAVVTQPRK